MLTGFTMFLHATICVILIAVILMQSGRGGGLTESFSSAESMFGAQTNAFMIKATSIFATIFLVTCLGLAVLSSKKTVSLMSNKVTVPIEKSVESVVGETQDQAPLPVSEATQ